MNFLLVLVILAIPTLFFLLVFGVIWLGAQQKRDNAHAQANREGLLDAVFDGSPTAVYKRPTSRGGLNYADVLAGATERGYTALESSVVAGEHNWAFTLSDERASRNPQRQTSHTA